MQNMLTMRLTHYDEHKKRWQINDDYGAVMIDELNYAVGEAIDKLAAYEDAEEQGRLVVLDRETALAIAAGWRAIITTKRFQGASYVYDPLGEDGGPYEIPYAKAGEILCNIWDKYPLDGAKEDNDKEVR